MILNMYMHTQSTSSEPRRSHFHEERKLNLETFGQATVDQSRYRNNYRGRGNYRGGNRGGGNNNNQGYYRNNNNNNNNRNNNGYNNNGYRQNKVKIHTLLILIFLCINFFCVILAPRSTRSHLKNIILFVTYTHALPSTYYKKKLKSILP